MGKRGGRPRKKGKREANGKLSRRVEDKQARRSLDEQAAMLTAREGRERVHGVRMTDSATDLAGSVAGRLYLKGGLTTGQLKAAWYLRDTYAAFQRAVDSPRPPKAVALGQSSGGEAPDVSAEQSARARKNWRTMTGLLQDENCVHRGAAIYAACDFIVLRDLDLPHLEDSLKLGLDAIARTYGLEAKAA